jgi:hypothetical protein
MQKVVFRNELCRCACVCANVIQTGHTTMSVTRMKTVVIPSESLGYSTGDEHAQNRKLRRERLDCRVVDQKWSTLTHVTLWSLRVMLRHGWHQLHGYYTSKGSRFHGCFPTARQFLWHTSISLYAIPITKFITTLSTNKIWCFLFLPFLKCCHTGFEVQPPSSHYFRSVLSGCRCNLSRADLCTSLSCCRFVQQV